ncbi:MAG: protein kinase [Planctomycetota bacterium]
MAGEDPAKTSIDQLLGDFGAQLLIGGILSSRQWDELRQKVDSGKWPSTARELASRMVYERWLTEYQAKRMLAGKAEGLVIGRYTILDRIGSGSMGRVYRAQHQLMGRIVALKVISPELISNERVVSRFMREMRLVARLDHPNVVRAFDADQVDNMFYIVMEFVPGKSLGEMLKLGPLPAVDVIRYASQAALGLGHAHEQGILHRDVKPSNLMYSQDQKIVKVLDLGLGTLMEVDPEESFRTADGIAVGTIDYMSPEQASGKALDGRSDLYSLACCMYHLMTGRSPFQHENPISRLAMRIQSKPTPIRDYLPDLPSRVVSVIDKMLATMPEDRYQSGFEASEALQSLLRKKRKGAGGENLNQEPDSGKGSGIVLAIGDLELDQLRESSSDSAGAENPRRSSIETVAPKGSGGQNESDIRLRENYHEDDLRQASQTVFKAGQSSGLSVAGLLFGMAATFAIGFFLGRMSR